MAPTRTKTASTQRAVSGVANEPRPTAQPFLDKGKGKAVVKPITQPLSPSRSQAPPRNHADGYDLDALDDEDYDNDPEQMYHAPARSGLSPRSHYQNGNLPIDDGLANSKDSVSAADGGRVPSPLLLEPGPYDYENHPSFLAPPTAPASSAHGLGLGPTLVVLDDPGKKYLTAQQSFYASAAPTVPHTQDSAPLDTSPNPPIHHLAPPLPVSLPRLPCIPPLVVHQEQLYFDDGLGAPGRCPHDRKWGPIGQEHREDRGLGLTDVEMDDFMVDLGDLISKEFDSWVERCWVEAFHYTYTVSLPALIIGFILAGATPTFLRRNIIYGGPEMDALLARHFQIMLREEHDRRMSDVDGSRRGVDIGNLLAGLVPGTLTNNPPSPSKGPENVGTQDEAQQTNGNLKTQPGPTTNAPNTPPLTPNGVQQHQVQPVNPSNQDNAHTPSGQRHLWDPARTGYGNGICFHDLALLHGRLGDDHAPCMCDLTICRTCFHELLFFRGRRDLMMAGQDSSFGVLESHFDAEGMPMTTAGPSPMKRPSALAIRHPDMADILLVEEHLRTRLHYMASPDVILRYGDEDEFFPSWETNAQDAAQPGVDQDSASQPRSKETAGKNAQVKIINGKKGKGGKLKVPIKPSSKSSGDCEAGSDGQRRLNGSQLPRTWTEETASARNMAVILTFRHLVKLLHATAVYLSPFDFEEYADDSAVLTEIHPLAVYRRLVEPYVRRRALAYAQAQADAKMKGLPFDDSANDKVPGGNVNKVDVKAWKRCMEQWEKEVAVREKEGGNAILKTQPARAVAFYTQAICLDSENPIYYLNRAAAFNAIENYEDAEIDCSRALSLNKTHMKAWYRRAVARKGMGKLDEAEQDLLHLLNQAPNIAAASAELASIRKEIEEMKKREEVDDLD